MSDLDSLMMHADLANKEARMDNATVTALPGVWTPWAQVLCYACHGVRGPLTEEVLAKNCDDRTATPETELDWGEAQCRCHECGARIWVRSDVGKLARICDIVNDDDSNGTRAELWQTGGMCCAAALRQGEDRLVMVTALDGPFVLASYPNEDATYEGGYEALCELPWDNACESVAKAGVELLGGEIPAVCLPDFSGDHAKRPCESCGGSALRYETSTDSTDCVDCGASQ